MGSLRRSMAQCQPSRRPQRWSLILVAVSAESHRSFSTYPLICSLRRRTLLDLLARGAAKPEERWTLDSVPGDRLANIPLYVLTSRRTFSVAESFAFGLRITGRAKVVGETTAGGGHFTKFMPFASRLSNGPACGP